MQKLKYYAFLIKKYSFETIKIISIVLFIFDLVFIFIYHPEFRTIGYNINTYSFRCATVLIPFWIGYFIYKEWFSVNECNLLIKIVRFLVFTPLVFVMILTILFAFYYTFQDFRYEECMEWCVANDLSNYSECSLNTCDFPI